MSRPVEDEYTPQRDADVVAVGDVDSTAPAAPGRTVGSSLGAVVARLDLLGMQRSPFVGALMSDRPEKPENYETIIASNTGREAYGTSPEASEVETGANNSAA